MGQGYFYRQGPNRHPNIEIRIILIGLCLQQKNVRQPVLSRRSRA
ncbi:protein of unassigned function [Methylobacterium oryzae CBMB20]|uniref:Protein of unassigned function n=1 Tax=Methylobacterium oryzae CBMB20 TaxID=693986 RepID=A0A089NUH0_9HYPH|nr:protein of unassigned function [Methylobacterium oryzae CBMB20]